MNIINKSIVTIENHFLDVEYEGKTYYIEIYDSGEDIQITDEDGDDVENGDLRDELYDLAINYLENI